MVNRLGVNCSKKNPALCRLHGKQYTAARNLLQQVREQEKRNALNAIAAPDFDSSWKIKKEADGTSTVSVYRSGVPHPPAQRGVEAQSYLDADKYKPEGRPSRTAAVFASPTLGGVCRWVKGNWDTNIADVKVRELRVDIDKTYVYNIAAWEKASGWETKEYYEDFWDTGITLREYMQKAKQDPEKYKPTEWELMLDESQIRSVKPVGAVRASQNTYYNDSKYVQAILEGKNPNRW